MNLWFYQIILQLLSACLTVIKSSRRNLHINSTKIKQQKMITVQTFDNGFDIQTMSCILYIIHTKQGPQGPHKLSSLKSLKF